MSTPVASIILIPMSGYDLLTITLAVVGGLAVTCSINRDVPMISVCRSIEWASGLPQVVDPLIQHAHEGLIRYSKSMASVGDNQQ